MHADGVALGGIADGAHDGPAQILGSRAPQITGGAAWPPWEGWVFSLMCAMCFPDAKSRESEAF